MNINQPFFIVLSFFLLIGCQQSTSQRVNALSAVKKAEQVQQSTITLITPADLEVKMSDSLIQLIDVRTEKEWGVGHLKGAKRFEINNSNWETQISTLDKSLPVYVYCAKGGRSSRSSKQLQKAGFMEIYDLDGGITAWLNAGKPVE